MNLRPLKNEITFGLNRFYLLQEKVGYEPTYLVCVNQHVLRQCGDEIASTASEKFIRWSGRKHVRPAQDVTYLLPRRRPGFYKDIAKQGVWEGATVTYVAMQLAYLMGFTEVILIGVDHRFKTKGPAHKLITSEGDDPNHFDPNYFGKGFQWQLPDLIASEQAYQMADDAFNDSGRRVLNATVGGDLGIFKRCNYNALIKGDE